jgi:hypothetical protein
MWPCVSESPHARVADGSREMSDRATPDAECILRSVGEPECFAELFDRHCEMIYR